MTQEEKELLLRLFEKADEEGLINIYDNEENYCSVERIFLDKDGLCVKINQ